jgi:hypothetical protein
MNAPLKVGLVVGGYGLAFVFAFGVVAIYAAYINGPNMWSPGMYAFGDGLLFVAVFAVAAILPTGAALFFLRSSRLFWISLSVMAPATAATGLAAFIIYIAERGAESGSMLHAWSALAVLRILIAPLFGLTFFLSALFAPNRLSRIAPLGAAAIEAMVFVCVGLIWSCSSRSF